MSMAGHSIDSSIEPVVGMFYLPTRSVFLFSIIFVYLAVLCLLDPAMLPLKTIWIFINYYLHLCMYLPSVARRFVVLSMLQHQAAIKAKINADAQSS